MKVLHLIQQQQLRGAEVFAAQLAQHTLQLGHEAILVPLFETLASLPFSGRIIPLQASKKQKFVDFPAWRRLARIIREENPDVIQANAGDTMKYAALSKLIFGWRQPILFRNASIISMYIHSRPVKWLNSWFFRFADRIISVSNTSACDFMTIFPAYSKRVQVIPVGIENGHDAGKPALVHVLSQEHSIIVHVGGFTYEKNHIRLLNMFQRILKRCPWASLYLIGDGPLKKNMEEVVFQQGMDGPVRFFGARQDAIRLISEADVLVLPSIIEGLPGAILEAFYCGTPVVAYDTGGVCEIVKDKDTGRLIPAGDEDAFVEAVLSILQDSDQCGTMVQNAHRLVSSGYLNADVTARFLEIYQSCHK